MARNPLYKLSPAVAGPGALCSGCRRGIPEGPASQDQSGWLWCGECAGQIRAAAAVRHDAYMVAGAAFSATIVNGVAPAEAWRALSAAERAADVAYDVAVGNA